MAALGTVYVDILGGFPDPPRKRYEVLTRPGASGHGLKEIGVYSDDTILTAITFQNPATWASDHQTMLALEGTEVTITDAWGNYHANCSIVRITLRELKTVKQAIAGSLLTRYRAVWDVLVRRNTSAP